MNIKASRIVRAPLLVTAVAVASVMEALGCAALSQSSGPTTLAALPGIFSCEVRPPSGNPQPVAAFVRDFASALKLTIGKDGNYSLFRKDSPQSDQGYEAAKGKWALSGDTLTLTPDPNFKGPGSLSLLNYDMAKKLTLKVIGKDAKELKCFGPKTSETDPSTLETWFKRVKS